MQVNRIRIIAFILTLAVMMALLPMAAMAEETYGYEVAVEPSPAAIGEEVVLTVRLTDYDESKSAIRGFQIDIENSGGLLDNSVCTSLVTDTENLLSNTAAYQSARDLVRHVYAKMSGAMSYGQTDLLEVRIPIPETLTEAGTVTMPFTLRISNEAGENLTYTTEIQISYAPADEVPEEPIISVEVTWGALEYTYTEGTWNPGTHTYGEGSWTDQDTGYVTVKNTSESEVSAAFTYTTDRTDISGAFSAEDAPLNDTVQLSPEEILTVMLELSGKPGEYLEENTVIGSVTVTIGGV